MLNGEEIGKCNISYRNTERNERYLSIDFQAGSLIFPLSQVRQRRGFDRWLDSVAGRRCLDPTEQQAFKDCMHELREASLASLEEYEFPVVTLNPGISADAVCTIFETLNATGTRLSSFDLLVARARSADIKLRDLWDRAKAEEKVIGEFQIKPFYIAQVISLLTARGAPSCKTGDVLAMDVESIRDHWSQAIQGIVETLHLFRDECGVATSKWLPYDTMLIPAAATMAAAKVAGPAVATKRSKLKRRFWCSVFGQVYEQGAVARSAKDFVELKAWIIDNGSPPQSVAQFSFDPALLRQVDLSQSAVYRGVIAFCLSRNAKDFDSEEQITAGLMRQMEIEDHHVFPQAWLKREVKSWKFCRFPQAVALTQAAAGSDGGSGVSARRASRSGSMSR